MRVILGFTQPDRDSDYSSFADGFRPGAVQEVAVLVLPDAPDGLTVEQWAEAVFIASNAPGPHVGEDAIVPMVRAALRQWPRALRSLSVGDTVTVQGETVACDRAGWTRIEPAGTWTFIGHWDDDGSIVLENSVPGEVADSRIDDGRYQGGLWAAAAAGPSETVAAEIAIAEYES